MLTSIIIDQFYVVGDNDEILARVPAAGREPISAGTEVELSWDTDAVAVYDREPSAVTSLLEGGA